MQGVGVERADGGARRGGLAEVVSGLRLLCDGFRMLARERSLWALSVVPIGFSALALTLAAALVYRYAGAIDGQIDGLWPALEVGAWYAWIWIGPARALFWLLGVLLFVVAAALAAAVAVMLASVAAAPFLDALARRAERIAAGRVLESDASGPGALLRDVGRSIGGEARRMLFFLAIGFSLFGAGLVIPGAHIVTGPAMVLITILFLPLEFAGYALDRRQVPFAARRRWIIERWPRMAGFGTGAFAVCFVPGVNLLMMPAMVVAGTLLVLADPPRDGGLAGGEGLGSVERGAERAGS